MTHQEFVALMREQRPGFVRINTGGTLGEIYVTPETARAIDPNYCSTCTPKGLGSCRCAIASNE